MVTSAPQDPAAKLSAVIEALYHRLPPYVPATIEACSCAHCLPPDRRAQMIATPVRALPADLVRDYLDSAHGLPENPDDLRALLPRVLDLMAQDLNALGPETGFCLGLHSELRRFGAGRNHWPDLFDPETTALLHDWGRLMILHHGKGQAANPASPLSARALFESLLVGGWPPDVLIDALQTLFAQGNGAEARAAFLAALGTSLAQSGHLGLATLAAARPQIAPEVATALNRLLLSPAVQDLLLLTDPEDAPWAGALWAAAGQLTADHTLCRA